MPETTTAVPATTPPTPKAEPRRRWRRLALYASLVALTCVATWFRLPMRGAPGAPPSDLLSQAVASLPATWQADLDRLTDEQEEARGFKARYRSQIATTDSAIARRKAWVQASEAVVRALELDEAVATDASADVLGARLKAARSELESHQFELTVLRRQRDWERALRDWHRARATRARASLRAYQWMAVNEARAGTGEVEMDRLEAVVRRLEAKEGAALQDSEQAREAWREAQRARQAQGAPDGVSGTVAGGAR